MGLAQRGQNSTRWGRSLKQAWQRSCDRAERDPHKMQVKGRSQELIFLR